MHLRIQELEDKTLVGKSLNMSLVDNRTAELWKSFMPHRNEIPHIVGTDLYSLQIIDPLDVITHNPNAVFTKWAAIEVSKIDALPEGMSEFKLVGGLYAVFLHKGPANAFRETFQYIFENWLPNSKYKLDSRPQFEVLGEKYKNNEPDSEEEVWIPITQS
jgi:AraC family transcriptional regulator